MVKLVGLARQHDWDVPQYSLDHPLACVPDRLAYILAHTRMLGGRRLGNAGRCLGDAA